MCISPWILSFSAPVLRTYRWLPARILSFRPTSTTSTLADFSLMRLISWHVTCVFLTIVTVSGTWAPQWEPQCAAPCVCVGSSMGGSCTELSGSPSGEHTLAACEAACVGAQGCNGVNYISGGNGAVSLLGVLFSLNECAHHTFQLHLPTAGCQHLHIPQLHQHDQSEDGAGLRPVPLLHIW